MTAGLRAAAAAALLAAALAPACDRSAPRGTEEAAPAEAAPAPPSEDEVESLGRKPVVLYFPSSSSSRLVGEPREILRTPRPGDQAKQILSDLLAGPRGDSALAAVPTGTKLRQVYVLPNGTAYADFSQELKSAIGAGSDDEILTVYSIVNSVTLNIPQIFRLGILVEGRPCESLNGHLDLRRPLPPDRDLSDDEEPGAPTADDTVALPPQPGGGV